MYFTSSHSKSSHSDTPVICELRCNSLRGALYRRAPLSEKRSTGSFYRIHPCGAPDAGEFRRLRTATRGSSPLDSSQTFEKVRSKLSICCAPAACSISGGVFLLSRIKMGSGDNIPSEGFGGEQPPLQIRRRHLNTPRVLRKAHPAPCADGSAAYQAAPAS